MPALHTSAMSLRIRGDALEPDEISKMLGCEPSSSYRKGERFVSKTGKTYFKRTGYWGLDVEDCSPESINRQISEILGKPTSDLKVWAHLSATYRIDMFCGWFMEESSEGVSISPESLAALGLRGIELEVCLYGPIVAGDATGEEA